MSLSSPLTVPYNKRSPFKTRIPPLSFYYFPHRKPRKPEETRGGTPIGERFCAVLVWKRVYTFPILVWNRVWFLRELRECMNVFIVSILNEKERKRNMRIRNGFEEFFSLRSNLSNDQLKRRDLQ